MPEYVDDQGVGGRMGSEWILLGLVGGGGCSVDPFGSGKGPMAGSCEYGDERADSGAT
jgi:hypothetical protein